MQGRDYQKEAEDFLKEFDKQSEHYDRMVKEKGLQWEKDHPNPRPQEVEALVKEFDKMGKEIDKELIAKFGKEFLDLLIQTMQSWEREDGRFMAEFFAKMQAGQRPTPPTDEELEELDNKRKKELVSKIAEGLKSGKIKPLKK